MTPRRVRDLVFVALAVGLAVGRPAPAAAQEPVTHRLTLGGAARLAAQRSSSVLEAEARVNGADARVRQRTSELLPNVSADAIRGARTFNTASFGLDFPTAPGQEPLFDPRGEVRGPIAAGDVRARADLPLLDLAALARRRTAVAGADAAREEVRALEDVAAAGAARAYVSALRAEAEVSAREDDVKLAEDLLKMARGQLEAGVAVAIDVTRAEAQLATVRAQLVAARHRAEGADLAVRRALRLSDDEGLELTEELEAGGVGDVPAEESAVSSALSQREDLALAEALRATATESLGAARAARLPRLSAGLDEGFYGKGFDHMLRTYTWSLRLSVPVFDGFQRSARIEEERSRVREIDYRIEDLRSEVAYQVRQALLGLSSAMEVAGAVDERLRLATLEEAQEEERLRAGVTGTAEVVRAALRLNEARTAHLDALTSVYAARIALAAAMGQVTDLP
jgi:outer membrane protein TolC